MTDEPTVEDWRAEMQAAARKRQATGQARRLKARTVAEPVIRTVDRETVAVSLCGNRGRGREMLLDRDVWREVSARLGTRWVIETRPGGIGLCVCAEGTDPVVPLDRELVDVRRGDTLVHLNRDITDLRLSNLYTADGVVALSYAPNRLPRLPKAPVQAQGSAVSAPPCSATPEPPHSVVTTDGGERLDH